MSKSKYDVRAVKAALETVAARDPERRDTRVLNGHAPRYLHHGEPSCLGSYLLLELGFKPRTLRHLDDAGSVHVDVADIRKRFTREAWLLVSWVQVRNDSGWRWGATLEDAFRDHPDRWSNWSHLPYHPDCSFWRERPWLEKPTGDALRHAYEHGVGARA